MSVYGNNQLSLCYPLIRNIPPYEMATKTSLLSESPVQMFSHPRLISTVGMTGNHPLQ